MQANYRIFSVLLSLLLAMVAFWVSSFGILYSAPLALLIFVVLFLGFLQPIRLAKPYEIWMQVGHILGFVMTPVVLGLMYVVVITPTGIALMIVGKDVLNLKLDRTSSSYWLERPEQPGPMRKQY